MMVDGVEEGQCRGPIVVLATFTWLWSTSSSHFSRARRTGCHLAGLHWPCAFRACSGFPIRRASTSPASIGRPRH